MLTDLSLSSALDGLDRRDFSSRELTEAHLVAIEQLNPKLNAFITVTADQALDTARVADELRARGDAGPLAGAPLAIKDLFLHARCPHHGGEPNAQRLRAAVRE